VVAVLLILDGASEPLVDGEPTSLERASTPTLDGLAAAGRVTRLETVPPGLPPGSETAIPGLLGWMPGAAVDRGALEAAAHQIPLRVGEHAWRVDVARTSDGQTAAAELQSRLPHHDVRHLSGHRLLVIGSLPLAAAAGAPGLRVWPRGVVPPRVLDESTTVVAARGAAAGAARLMGAHVVVPDGATGRPVTDLRAKARAAVAAIERGAARVVVHVGGPDEAAHDRDAAGKAAAIERADAELLPALVDAVERAGGTLRVCPDHGCDPRTGEHDATPVPCIDWEPGAVAPDPDFGARLTERAVAAVQPVPA
jgi:2,3-bisphosphoglycerate-independent phosphoglycerate mutase